MVSLSVYLNSGVGVLKVITFDGVLIAVDGLGSCKEMK